MHNELFTLPFRAGLMFIMLYLLVLFIKWIIRMSPEDKQMSIRGFFSVKTLSAVKEIFTESLLHRKIFRINPLLGYMHMSLAFGWFVLIVTGHFQSLFYKPAAFHPPYYSIFFNKLESAAGNYPMKGFFEFAMDFLLLFILSGVMLAFYKRFRSSGLGMTKTTRLKLKDNIALISLWCIFPLRLLAESATSGLCHNGGFMTGSFGNALHTFLPLETIEMPLWWAYSISLGIFFFSLPHSRYMHIPVEMILIFFRNYGLKTCNNYNSFSDMEIKSCSRCGVCIDKCQMPESDSRAVYFIRGLRENTPDPHQVENCMMCGRCTDICPVGVDVNKLRLIARSRSANDGRSNYPYLSAKNPVNADVLFFAGCMTHLSPGIIESVQGIFNMAGINYHFMDKDGGACCGRPLKLAGRNKDAEKLINFNREEILNSGAETLVTSCPICLKTFREDYNLKHIRVLHHSQFILGLWYEEKIKISKQLVTLAYHDPCELGRGLSVYKEPVELLNRIGIVRTSYPHGTDSLCCGGSLADTELSMQERDAITREALGQILVNNPQYLATSCPLCKKTFAKLSREIPVMDIAELVYRNMLSRGTAAGKRKLRKRTKETAVY